jgi:hypothetical protein
MPGIDPDRPGLVNTKGEKQRKSRFLPSDSRFDQRVEIGAAFRLRSLTAVTKNAEPTVGRQPASPEIMNTGLRTHWQSRSS